MQSAPRNKKDLLLEIDELRAQLAEAQEIIREIHGRDVGRPVPGRRIPPSTDNLCLERSLRKPVSTLADSARSVRAEKTS
jgi:hypothetical protein